MSSITKTPADEASLKPGSLPGKQHRTGRSAFRPDIEGLRAIAVLLVVCGHAGVPFLSGGFVGVDVFFVISGFLITTLLTKELRATGTISIKGFYARRMTRLLPASGLVLIATLIATWLWLPVTRIASVTGDAIASSFYLINYRLASIGTDYLNADAPPSPLQHFWSLAVEEQFYFVWPLLLIGIGLLTRRRANRNIVIAAVLIVVLASSLTVSIVYTPTSASWSYFGIHSRAWELAAGALLAVGATQLAKLPRRAAMLTSWLGLLAIIAAALLYDENTVFPGVAAALPVAGTALIIAAGCTATTSGAGVLLKLQPFQFIGKISYSFYLWHWPILLIAPAAFGRSASVSFNLLAMLGALAITWLAYRFIENPIRHRKSLKTLPWRGIGVGVAITAGTASLALIAAWVVPLTAYQGNREVDTAEVMSQQDANTNTLHKLIAQADDNTKVPANLTPALEDVDDDRPAIYDNGCHLDITDAATKNKICSFGDTSSDTTVALFGDSHAAQWFPAMNIIAKERGWKLVPLTRSGCPVSSVDVVHPVLERRYTECDDWRANSYDTIKKLDTDLVVTTSINGQTPVDDDDKAVKNPDKSIVNGWDKTFTKLGKSSAKVAYLIDTPNYGEPVPDCIADNLQNTKACRKTLEEAMLRPERTDMITNSATNHGVSVVNPVSWFCQENMCPEVIGNTLIIRDSNHVTTEYTKVLAPLLSAKLPTP